MGRGEAAMAEALTRELGLSGEEAALYLSALKSGLLSGRGPDGGSSKTAESLLARGMVIRAAGGDDYVPVHPRLALSNLFRAYEDGLMRQRKEKRLLVDRLTLELIPAYEKSKRTNSTGKEGKGR